jgi:hypothetical protein
MLLANLEIGSHEQTRLQDEMRADVPLTLRALNNPELRALLAGVEPEPGASRAVADWSELPDRMRFIADLFRAYHTDETLFALPFTLEQTATLKAGKRPVDI